jgi:hypothetical protein
VPSKAASSRTNAKAASKSAIATGAKPPAKATRHSKLEGERLEKFNALIAKYAGRCSFAGYDG